MLIERNEYLEILKEVQWNGKVKVINGPRLSGKSYLLFSIFKQYLIDQGVPEGRIIERKLWAHQMKDDSQYELYKEIKEICSDKDKKYYLFIDDIQLFERPKGLLRSMLELGNVDIYVTGYDPYKLNSKAVLDICGDSKEIFVWPLTFREFHSFKKGTKTEDWKEYCKYGGLPFVVLDDVRFKSSRLDSMKDVFFQCEYRRRKLYFGSYIIKDLTTTMLISIGKIISPYWVTKRLNKEYTRASYNRVSNYMYYLCEYYFFGKSESYDILKRKRSRDKGRYYVFDVGVRNQIYHFWNEDVAGTVENIVYNDLRQRGFEVDVGVIKLKSGSDFDDIREKFIVDFVIHKWGCSYLIKYVDNLDEDNKEDIIRMFSFVDKEERKVVLTGNDISKHYEGGILFMNVLEFLLDKDILN